MIVRDSKVRLESGLAEDWLPKALPPPNFAAKSRGCDDSIFSFFLRPHYAPHLLPFSSRKRRETDA